MRTPRPAVCLIIGSVLACDPAGRDQDVRDTTTTPAFDTGRPAPVVETAGGDVASAAKTTSKADPDVVGVEVWRDLTPDRTPARDADHRFLRNMADRNQAILEVALLVMDRASLPATKEHAKGVHDTHVQHRDALLSLVQAEYREQLVPIPAPAHEPRMDSLHLAKDEGFDREYREIVIAQHRAWIRAIDDTRSQLRSPAVQTFAAALRADLQRELESLGRP